MKRKSHAVLVGLLSLFAVTLLSGCSNWVLFHPKGPIGNSERFTLIVEMALMAIIVIPVFIMIVWFSWKYRAGSTKATYLPEWKYSAKIDLVIWLVPLVIVTCLAVLAWTETHKLDPFKPLDSGLKPVRIEVVALDWKWLFIYPDQNIATVNQLVFPVKVPLSFRITSDTVITSFFIPQLGSQIYAMAGRQSRLHLLASHTGVFAGQNQQFSGNGYSDMFFKAIAVSGQKFQTWVTKVRQSHRKLDLTTYKEIAKPSLKYPVTYFSSVKPGLFENVIEKYKPQFRRRHAATNSNSSARAKAVASRGR